MISLNKKSQAFHALNGVLVQLRVSALRKENHEKIAQVLDVLEELPRFLDSSIDQTASFERSLRHLAQLHPEYGIGLELFLREKAPGEW